MNQLLLIIHLEQQFTEKFVAAVGKLKLGDGLDEGATIGPMISAKAVKDVKQLVDGAVELGASIAFERSHELNENYLAPIVLTNVTNDMPIAQKEIFGPVSTIIPFDDEQHAIALANDTEFGLAAYFYARDIGRIWRVAEGLDFGMVGINEGIISNAAAPFGGIKQSGSGREGSKYGLDDYVTIKYLCMGGLGA